MSSFDDVINKEEIEKPNTESDLLNMLDHLPWKELEQEALEHFRSLLKIDTTNPPGNELEAINYLKKILKKDKIAYQVFETGPNRGNLVARLPGSGEKKPLLLNAHLDVVHAEEEHWSYPPFSATIADGYVWGRGTLDMKNMAIMSLMVLLIAKRFKLPFSRDLIFCAVADEEAGSTLGAQWLVENQPDAITAEYAFNELGGFTIWMDGIPFYPLQVSEKGICWLQIRALGKPGHGSLPNPDNPLTKIGTAAARLGKNKLPMHKTPVVERFITQIAHRLPKPKGMVLKLLLKPHLSNLILEHLLPDPALSASFHAVLHNTANPTIIRGGKKINVVPSDAELEVDGRILPGQTPESFVEEIRALLGHDYQIEVTKTWPATETDPNDPLVETISSVIRRHTDRKGIVLPNMIPGFTDSAHYARLGMKCFGFSPVKLRPTDRFAQLYHGHNEKIPVDGFWWGMRVLVETVSIIARSF